MTKPLVAIINLGMGNLFSLRNVCQTAGLEPRLTRTEEDILDSDCIILPGVGAFGTAMDVLKVHHLPRVLHEAKNADIPIIGICLGMQLFMERSYEFGEHEGLKFIRGDVVRFEGPQIKNRKLKVPEICWNEIKRNGERGDAWEGTPLAGLPDRACVYFNHSYYVRLQDPGVCIATSQYGNIQFCSSLKNKNIIGFQFHPERSGRWGLEIYRNLAKILQHSRKI
jgi:glutamine amidotransferase